MDFEWDEKKNQSNIGKHGYDFKDVSKALLNSKFVYKYQSAYQEENRIVAICTFSHDLIAIVYTLRSENIRIISVRKARKIERKKYEEARREHREI